MTKTDILNDLVSYLKEQDIEYSNVNVDGRVNSSNNEKIILNLVLNWMNDFNSRNNTCYEYESGKKREWYDFKIILNNREIIPVNIKISEISKNKSDNLNCKLGIYYALTGEVPNMDNETPWENYFKMLKDNLKENDKDYYFLVCDKENIKNIFITSLKQLKEESVSPNGNNLPFQCKFSLTKDFNPSRSYEDAKKFILSKFEDSIKLRAKILDYFKKYFSNN